jgi:6-phosphofructokinase 1
MGANRDTQHRKLGKRKTIVIIAEGAQDRHGDKITPEMVKDLLADKDGLALDTRITTLGHVQRGGTAVAYDRMLATLQGVEAVKAVLEATPETKTCFIAITENKIVRKPLMEAVQETKSIAKAIEAQEFDKAMTMRDTEFFDQYASYMMTTAVTDRTLLLPEKEVSIGSLACHDPNIKRLLTRRIANEDRIHKCGSPRRRHECRHAGRCRVLHEPGARTHRDP